MMKQFIRKYRFALLFFIIAQVYLLLSYTPVLILASRTPSDRIFLWEHSARVSMDYNIYLSVINQGMHGSWLMHDVWTTESFNPSFFYIFYIFLGKITGIFHLKTYVAYHVARIVSTELLFLGIFLLSRKILGKTAGFFASVLSLVSTILPYKYFSEAQAYLTYVPWWSNLEAFRRYDTMPHYLFAFATLTFGIISTINYYESKRMRYFISMVGITVVNGLILPPSVFPMLIATPGAYVITHSIRWIRTKQLSIRKDMLIGFIVLVIAGAASLFIIRQENFNGFPWDTWNVFETSTYNKNSPGFNLDFLMTLGFIPYFAAPAFVKGIIAGDMEIILLGIWGYLPFVLLPFADILNVSKARFTNIMPIIPLSILTVYTFAKLIKIRNAFIIIGMVVFFAATSIPISYQYLMRNVDYVKNKQVLFINMFMPFEWWHALEFLNTKVPPNSKIFSGWVTSNLLPGYAPVITFAGHINHTYDFFTKKAATFAFFANTMKLDQAKALMKTYDIDYVFFGYGEKENSWVLTYPFLEKVFSEGDYQIYKVNL